MRRYFRSLSVKTRVIAVVIVIVIAGIWGLAYRVSAILEHDFERILSEQLAVNAGYVADDIESKIRLRIDRLQEAGADITPDMLADPRRNQRLFEQRAFPKSLFPLGVLVPTEEAFALIAAIKQEIYLATLLLSLLLALVLHAYLSRQLTRLKDLAAAMHKMTEGKESLTPLAITRKDEIGEIKESFNRLLAERTRLEQALRGEIAARKFSEQTLLDATKRLQAFSQRVIRVQEDERRGIAAELHEQMAQELISLKLHLQLSDSQQGDKAAGNLSETLELAEMELERVRRMAASDGANSGGLGLNGIHERVESAGGSVTVASNHGEGTEVCAVFPHSSHELPSAVCSAAAG